MLKKAFFILAIIASITCQAQSEKRLALVVGNSNYLGKGSSLTNPEHDAVDVSAKLKTLGFDVTTLIDGSLLQMDDAIDAFGRNAKSYDIALFYYSGHGLQSKGNNYLVPVDAELRSEADVKYKCTALNYLLDKLEESECPMKIVVLDACRNNPFAKSWYRGDLSTGLASVNPPKGTFITFSTASGSVALDGTGRNSPYTTAFLETLDTPNLSLFEFFNEVGKHVLKATDFEQDPWTNHNTMTGSFFFNKVDLSVLDKEQHSVFPQWINSKHDGEWIGISMPMEDKAAAKRMALVNAVVKYLMLKGDIDMVCVGNIEINNKTFDSPLLGAIISEDQFFTANTFIRSSGLQIKTINEFYNKNNECFLSCSICEDSISNCLMVIEQRINVDQTQKHLSYSILALFDKEQIQIDYTYSIKAFGEPDIQLFIDNTPIPIIPVHYPNVRFDGTSLCSSHYFSIAMYGSIGLAELAIIAQSPTIPTFVRFMNYSIEQGMDQASISQHSTAFETLGRSQPFPLLFNEISNDRLGITIHDPYDKLPPSSNLKKYFESIQSVNNGDTVISNYQYALDSDNIVVGWASHEIEPLLMEKTIAMYQAIFCLGQKMSSHYTGTIERTDSDSTEWDAFDAIDRLQSQTYAIVSSFHPFFFLDGCIMDPEKKHGKNTVCVAYDKSNKKDQN